MEFVNNGAKTVLKLPGNLVTSARLQAVNKLDKSRSFVRLCFVHSNSNLTPRPVVISDLYNTI